VTAATWAVTPEKIAAVVARLAEFTHPSRMIIIRSRPRLEQPLRRAGTGAARRESGLRGQPMTEVLLPIAGTVSAERAHDAVRLAAAALHWAQSTTGIGS